MAGKVKLSENLAVRCREFLDWKNTGLLVDGEQRKLAASLENIPNVYRLTIAENQTATEAMQEVAGRALLASRRND